MNAQQRRKEILNTLQQTTTPVSATALAQQLGVSRQIIVGDVALLRAGGMDIAATPRGYILPSHAPGLIRTLAARHHGDQMEAELNAIVDQGCTVIDVIVEHPIYGQISADLNIDSRFDAQEFVQRQRSANASQLCDLTGGLHLHMLRVPNEETFLRIVDGLRTLGILCEDAEN